MKLAEREIIADAYARSRQGIAGDPEPWERGPYDASFENGLIHADAILAALSGAGYAVVRRNTGKLG